MRGQTTWRLWNTSLNVDLFEQSSQSPDTSETSFTIELIEPIEIAKNDEGNARKRLSDYSRPVPERVVTIIHAPLNRGVNFRSPLLITCYLMY